MLYQITNPPNRQFADSGTAVLLSGGLDSAVLLAEEALNARVHPVYISVGVAWEGAEREAIGRFLDAWSDGHAVEPLASLSVDMTDVYPAAHWARRGDPPGYHTPDEDVYLPGRNIVLLGKAAIYCAAAGIGRLVIGTLDHNPFPDATPAFRGALQTALSMGLDHPLQIDAPYSTLEKSDVVRRGAALDVPLALTLSCMNPVTRASGGAGKAGQEGFPRHCGRCSKCRERHDAFLAAGIADPTDYADSTFVQEKAT